MQKIAVGELEKRIGQTRQQLLTAVAALPEEVLLKERTIRDWSVRDLLAYLSVWYDVALVGIREIQRRKKPGRLLRMIEGGRKFEVQALHETRKLELEDLLETLDNLHIQIETQLEQLSAQDLNELKRHRWMGNKQLWPFLAQITYEHEKPYVAMVEALVRFTEAAADSAETDA